MKLMNFSIQQAATVIAAARKAAEGMHVPMNIAVMDAGAHLKAFERMDGALLGSIDIAVGKAKTSALFGTRTENLGEYSKAGGPAPGLELTNGGLVVFAGGVPLTSKDGTVIGAVGISGGTPSQDGEVASAAAASL
jgi:uncharacterized protein GlcG (DUF336 family)